MQWWTPAGGLAVLWSGHEDTQSTSTKLQVLRAHTGPAAKMQGMRKTKMHVAFHELVYSNLLT